MRTVREGVLRRTSFSPSTLRALHTSILIMELHALLLHRILIMITLGMIRLDGALGHGDDLSPT